MNINFEFPYKRYHATPWGAHPNEGLVEWPPSPWRILRAFVSIWHNYYKKEIERKAFESIIEKLSISTPTFNLPDFNSSHKQHYFSGKYLTYDTFYILEGPISVIWDISLNKAEEEIVEKILLKMNYLGRKESVVMASLEPDKEPNFIPSRRGSNSVLLVKDLKSFNSWRERFIKEKEGIWRNKDIQEIPKTLLEALEKEPKDLYSWTQPPGSKKINYCSVQKESRKPYKKEGIETKFHFVRYSLPQNIPIPDSKFLSLANKIHKALVKISNSNSVFTGYDSLGKRLEGHKHTYILPEIHNKKVTHFILYSSEGFFEESLTALTKLKFLWSKNGKLKLNLVEITKELTEHPLFKEGSVWESKTPFVSTRFKKITKKGIPKLEGGLHKGSPEHDLIRLLKLKGYPEPISIKRLEPSKFSGFETKRKGIKGSHGGQQGVGFRVKFPHKVKGPLSLGYGAHFGLGSFERLSDD